MSIFRTFAMSGAASRQQSPVLALIVALSTGAGVGHAQVANGLTLSDPSQLFGYDIPNDYSRGRNVSVLDRPRPGYDALGIQEGVWLILPRLEAGPGFITNVFGAPNQPKADAVFAISPSVSVHNDSDSLKLQFDAGMSLREYEHHTSNNETAAFLDGAATYVVDRDTTIGGGVYARRTYIESDSGGFPTGAISPVPVDSIDALIRATHQLERFRFTGAAAVENQTFESVSTQTGATISQAYQDRTIGRFSGRLEYGLTPDAAVFGQTSFTNTGYRLGSIGAAPERDSKEWRVLGGANFDLSHLIRGVVGLGYVDREYDSGFYGSISGFAGDAQVEYFPTELTTVTFDMQRLVQDSATSGSVAALGSPGYFSNTASIGVDHELLRNVILSGSVRYEYDQYKQIDRSDRITNYGLGARYLLTREIGLSANVNHIDRSSTGNVPGPGFSDTRGILTIVLQR